MSENRNTKTEKQIGERRGFWARLLFGLVDAFVKYIIAFTVGTGAAGIACWYYGIPLVFSLLGGIFVLGLALAISSESSIF